MLYGVWQPKAGLNIVQYRYNSTHKKHIVQEMSYKLQCTDNVLVHRANIVNIITKGAKMPSSVL